MRSRLHLCPYLEAPSFSGPNSTDRGLMEKFETIRRNADVEYARNHVRISVTATKGRGQMNETIAVVGLGYVGLPVALSFLQAGFPVIGYDVNERRIAALKNGWDWTGEAEASALLESDLHLTLDAREMAEASFFIITVPTPIDGDRRPDLSAVIGACE